MADTVSRTYFRTDHNRRKSKDVRKVRIARLIQRRSDDKKIAVEAAKLIEADKKKVALCRLCLKWFHSFEERNAHMNTRLCHSE